MNVINRMFGSSDVVPHREKPKNQLGSGRTGPVARSWRQRSDPNAYAEDELQDMQGPPTFRSSRTK